jgi:hypothetical protein
MSLGGKIRPGSASQTRTDWLPEPDAIRLPLDKSGMDGTPAVWLSGGPETIPVRASQIWMDLSEPDAIRLPSEENATDHTQLYR